MTEIETEKCNVMTENYNRMAETITEWLKL